MVSKNNKKLIAEKNRRNEKQRFAIRKLNVGVASVLLGITFSIYGGGQAVAHADTGNARGQVAARDAGDNSLATKSEVALSSANQSSTSATSANGAVQSQSSANSQPAATANTPVSDSAVASNAAVEATKNQSTAENQPSPSQKVQTPAQPVAQENGSSDASLNTTRQVLHTIANRNLMLVAKSFAAVPASDSVETSTLNLFTNQETNANALAESKVATTALAAETEDPNAVTVSTAQDFINAIQKGTANTINVASDLNLGNIKSSTNYTLNISNKRDLVIQSADGDKKTIDLNGYSFRMSSDNSVTFKDLTMYGRNWFGAIENASSYTFDNVDYTGSELVYTTRSATVTFKNNVTAHAVDKYTSPLDGEEYKTQPGQQVLQFTTGTNQIIFDEGSNVTLETDNGNVIQNQGDATITVKNGANVTLNPHASTVSFENAGTVSKVARGIYSAGGAINIEQGGNLVINLSQNSGDPYLPGAIYLNSGAVINDNGNIKINVNGAPYNGAKYTPVYLNGDSTIKVGNGASFEIAAENLGDFNSSLFTVDGKGTVTLEPHSTFKITGDGTGAVTAVGLGSGSTFTSDQPDAFTIDLSANTSDGKALIKNGTIKFSRVKTVTTDGTTSEPLGKIDVTYDRNGNATSYTITAQDENTVKQVADGLTNKSLINLVQAGEDVTLSNLHLSKNNVLTGTVASSGSDNPIYVTVTVGGVSTNVPVAGNYTVYTNTNGTVTSDNVDYAAQTGSTGGNFSIDLSKLASSLTDDTQVTVTATKDFVEGSQTESVAALRALNTATLQELVDAAPAEKAKPSYYNATAEAQKAYTDAISTGKTILANPNNYDQVDVDDAVTAIQNAQKALTGEPTNKTELQDAIDQASTVESNDNYTNADSNLQKAYTDAISAGQTVLSNDNATQTEVDNALTTINNAKDALNGDAKKTASKEALQKAVNEAPTVKSDDAAYYNGSAEAKAAYDNAITAGQTVLANPDATATQITDALTAINTAKGNLKGEATDKSALQKAVDNSTTVKESINYTNADKTQKTAYDNAVTAAQTVLDKTNATQAEVNQALQDLETANNNLNGDAKTEAANKAALEAAVKDAPNVRNTPAYYNGSEEAQTAYNNAINAGQAVLDQANPAASEVKNALDAINAAKDNLKGVATNTEALETALTSANKAKETGNYTNADQAKQEALNNAITAGQEILKNTNATQAQVNSAAKAITEAISGLNGNANLEDAKDAATEAIQKALDSKTTQITDATNIDQATKEQLIADAKKAAENANTAINQATDPNAVNTAKAEGITNINKVTVPSLDGAKEAANKAIDQALDTKTKEINNAENIDQTTKDQLIKEATDAANTAKDAIKKSTTNDEATKAGQAGVDAINNVKVPSVTDSQNAAKEAIDNALNAKTKEINDANNIDQTTKDQLIKEATDAANNAKEAIDKATAADAIKTARDEGTTNINNVTVPSLEDAKKAANKAVDDALTAQTEVINKANNLSDAEKKDLIDQVTAEANKAKENIETATTNNEAAQAGQAGVDAIKKIVPTSLDTVKSDANKAIDDALTKKLEEINSANDLTTDEKTALTQEANTAADKAKEEITNATTNDAVIEAQNNGVTAIDGIKVPTESAVKEAAKQAVADAATAKNKAIDASNLTDEEKADLKQKVTEAQNAADQAIDNATTNAAVTEAQNKGVNTINGIKVPTTSATKEQAITDLNTTVDDAKKAIDQDNNLTDEQKQAAKDQIDSDAKTAQDAINNAKTNDDVKKAADNGTLAIDKDVANAAIDNAVAGKKAEISNSSLTDEEKAALNSEVDQKAQDAKEAINNAITPEAVTTAQDNGIKNINDTEVPTESTAKEAAKKAITEAAEAKNNAIDSSNLTDEEKAALKQEVTDAQNAANTAIDNATTNAAVTEAEDNGIKAINGIEIPTKSPAKDQATTDLNDAVNDAKKAIDQDNNLTDAEKQAAKDQIDSDAKKAQEAIDNAKTDDEVKTAVDNGQLAIDKDVANAAIDNAVAGKKAEIAKAPLTTDEANALNDLVDQEAKAAKKAIDSATTIPAVEDAKNTGVAAINDIAVPTTSSTKDQANQTIDDALANKIKEINDATNLSDKQKQDLIDQANEEAAKAKENIKNATSNEAVNKATTDGVDAIANVTVPSLDDAKKDASQVIDDVLKQKEDEINNASHLTEQEKQDLINQAQNAANEAKDKINQATTNDDVATERDTGAEKIANIVVPSLEDAKDKATKAIDDALADKTKEINDQTHLSDQEKNDLIKQITDIADKAKDKINNDSNDAEVAKDEKDGIDAIVDTKVPGLEDRKQNAIKTLDEAKSTKLAQIDEATHLTADEKANLTQQVDAEYNKALDNINKATTNDDADKASADGVEAILNIAVPSLDEKKQDSIDALNEVREAKKEEINNANNLSQDEKDELTKQVDQIADNAINAIDGAKDDQTAKDAENKGIQDILDVKVPSLDEAKTNAKQAVADALESKTNEINAASNLDSATKQELINRANAEADTAIEKIDQATSNDQALAASQAGVDKILGIEVPTLADAKQSAIDAINDALKQKETEINNASQLTSDEKQNLINQVNSIADNAKNAINNATTNQSVEEAKNAGIEKINAINVPTTSATKDEAIKAIDDALTNKVNEINNATNITAEEKANLIDEANNAANTAKDNITKATSDSEVATATTDGIDAIANVTVPSLETAKDQAKNMIDDVLNEKKNEINNAQNLSDKQKQDLINQATDEADQAKKNIDNATTNNDVQTAEDNGAQAIENVTVPSLDNAKKASTKVIDEVLKEKTAEINAATNLSNAEKDALIKDATTAANTAKDNIAKATTNDAVKDAETDGIKAILDIKVPGREDQQKDAIAALDRALADKVSEINNANNLSETTKQDLKQQAQAAYTTAVDNVNNAQTSAEINTARDNGVQAILDITVPTLTDAQDASITAIEQVRDAKKTQIEAAKNLTEAQKEALKNQVDEIADKAIDNIKNATTDATVKDAETAGINEILNVTIPTLEAAKSDAKQAITDALTAKTAEINAAQNLTDAEKQKLIDQAQTEAAAANKKIDAATTNDAVELAAKNGVQAILDIQVPTVEETRDQAKKNVDNALNSKKEEINNSNLSPAAKEALINEAEQAAENARTAIDNATTASAISEAEAAGIAAIENIKVSNAPTESDNSSNHQTNTETPTEGNSTSQDNNNATQAPVQGNNTQADLTGSHGTNLTTGQQTEKAADTNSKEALPQTGNETERGLSIAGLAIASLLGLFGLSGLGKKKRD